MTPATPFACEQCNVLATVGEPYCDKHRPAEKPSVPPMETKQLAERISKVARHLTVFDDCDGRGCKLCADADELDEIVAELRALADRRPVPSVEEES